MSTTRKAIRGYIVNLLSTPAGAPAVYPIPQVEDRVYPNRSKVLRQPSLPAIAVYTLSDRHEKDLGPPGGVHWRVLTLGIHILGMESAGLDDDLDDIAELVMQLIFADPHLNGMVVRTDWVGDEMGFSADGLVTAGAVRMAFEVTYQWDRAESALDKFLVAAGGFDINGLGPELVGGTDLLVKDIWYVVTSGTINGKNIGPFKATTADVNDFTSPTQKARRADHTVYANLPQ